MLCSFVGCFHKVDSLIHKVQCCSCPCFVSDFSVSRNTSRGICWTQSRSCSLKQFMLCTVNFCEPALVLLCVHFFKTKQVTIFFLLSLSEVWLETFVWYPKHTFLSVQHWLSCLLLLYHHELNHVPFVSISLHRSRMAFFGRLYFIRANWKRTQAKCLSVFLFS